MKYYNPIFWSLVFLGIGIIIYGAYNLINAEQLADTELKFEDKNIQIMPVIQSLPKTSTINEESSIEYIYTNYTTDDVFAINNPIRGLIEVHVKNSTLIEKITIIGKSYAYGTILGQASATDTKLMPVIDNPELELTHEPHSDSFVGTWTFTPVIEKIDPIVVRIHLKTGVIKQTILDGVLPSIRPFADKLQVDVNRISIMQTTIQAQNNHKVEGLSWIIVGWIPLEVSIQLRRERVKEHREIIKIHSLLNSDYSMIKRIVLTYKDIHENLNNKIQNQNYGTYYTSSTDALQEFITETQIKLMFTHWDALLSSGMLIKLEGEEIEIFQVSHDEIMNGLKRETEAWQKMADELAPIIQDTNKTSAQKESEFNQISKKYLDGVLKYYDNALSHVSLVKINCGWVDLNAEFKVLSPPPTSSTPTSSTPTSSTPTSSTSDKKTN